MQLQMYQTEASTYRIYPIDERITYPALGLAGEVGEVCEKIKKSIRGDYDIFDKESLDAIESEMGDVLWYLAALASDLHLRLSDIAEKNLIKLESRRERNKIKGEGDER